MDMLYASGEFFARPDRLGEPNISTPRRFRGPFRSRYFGKNDRQSAAKRDFPADMDLAVTLSG